MKKALAIVLTFMLLLGFVSCGKKSDISEDSGDTSTESSVVENTDAVEETSYTSPDTSANDGSKPTSGTTTKKQNTKSDSNSKNEKTVEAKGSEYVKGLKMKDLKNKKIRVLSSQGFTQIEAANKPDMPQTAYHAIVVWKQTYGVDVQLDVVASESVPSYLAATYAADDMPDVIGGNLPSSTGLIKNLEGLIDFNDVIYNKKWNDLMKHQGKHYSVGIKKEQREYIIFNETRFRLEGQKTPLEWYKEGKWTWSQFVETAKKMTNSSKDQYGFTGSGFRDKSSPFPMIKVDEKGKLSLNVLDPNHITYMTEMFKLVKIHKAVRTDVASANWREEFVKGKDAMLVANEYEFSVICKTSEKIGGDDFGIAPMPVFDPTGEKQPYYTATIMAHSIASKSKNPEGAAEYIRLRATINYQMQEKLGIYESAEKYLTSEERKALNEQANTPLTYQLIHNIGNCSAILDKVNKQRTAPDSNISVRAMYEAIIPELQREIDEYNKKIK